MRTLFPEWRDQAGATLYPFAEDATLTNGTDTLIAGTLLDAAIYPVGGSTNPYLASVTVDYQGVTIAIGDDASDNRATGFIPLVPTSGLVALTDANGMPAGLLVSDTDRLSVLQSWGVGTHSFTVEQTAFAATVCFPTPETGVRGILLDTGELIVGDVWLVGADGVVFRPDEASEPGPCGVVTKRAIRMDVVGDPLFRRRLCTQAALFNTPLFITSVLFRDANHEFVCTPDELGNIRMVANNFLAADSILRVVNAEGSVTVSIVGSTDQTTT